MPQSMILAGINKVILNRKIPWAIALREHDVDDTVQVGMFLKQILDKVTRD